MSRVNRNIPSSPNCKPQEGYVFPPYHEIETPYRIMTRKTFSDRALAFWCILGNGNEEDLPVNVPNVYDHPIDIGTMRLPSLARMRQIQWSYKAQPCLAFILKEDFFDGPIWGRFRGDRFSFTRQIISVPGRGFKFNIDMANSWLRLEAAVAAIVDILYPSQRYGEGNALPPRPIRTGYTLVKESKEKVLATIMFAQKLFVLLAAELSHAVALSDGTSWKEKVMRENPNYTLNWLMDLEASAPLDRTRTDRVGVIVDTARMHKPSNVTIYPTWRVPAYVWFATIFYTSGASPVLVPVEDKHHAVRVQLCTPVSTRTMMANLAHVVDHPTIRHGDELLHVYYELPTTAKVSYSRPVSRNTCESPYMIIDRLYYTPQDRLPEPYPLSGQYYGQTWEDFMADRREINRNNVQFETCAERALRLQRRLEAFSTDSPPEVPVYEWRVTTHPHFRLRTRLHKDELYDIWGAYWPSQRIYDEVFNEWDLCDLIPADQGELYPPRPHPVAPALDDDTCLDIEQRILEETPPIPLPIFDLAQEDAMQRRSILLTNGLPSHYHSRHPDLFAIHQFGLLLNCPVNDLPLPKLNWVSAFGLQQVVRPADHTGDAQMRVIVEMICSPDNNDLDRFANKLDIHPSGPLLSSPHLLTFRRADGSLTERGETRPITLYIITFDEEVPWEWEMAVESASSVVLAIRQGWGSSRRTMVERFLAYGIPFYTLVARPAQATLVSGYLPPVYTRRIAEIPGEFRLSHFQQYQEEREAFFDSPFGRVAGRSGGILARLWRQDHGKFQRRFEEVLLGPTPYAEIKSAVFDLGAQGCYIDDELSNNMIMLICGGYSRPHTIVNSNSTRSNGERLSWYPPPNVCDRHMERKGKRWSERHELWCQQLDRQQIPGSRQPLSSNAWDREMNPRTKKFDVCYENLAAQFLEVYLCR